MASEAELAAALTAWLEGNGWEVYQEVQIDELIRADIVATHGPVVWIIETKTSLSMELAGQALRWRPYANKVSIGIPKPKRPRTPGSHLVMRTLGLGELHVSPESYGHRMIREHVIPVWGKIRRDKLKASLREEHKHMAKAGTINGGYWTPFRLTVADLTEHVAANPGITLGDAIAAIDHHYMGDKSAKQCISQYLREGVIKGIRLERKGRTLTLYPQGDQDGTQN